MCVQQTVRTNAKRNCRSGKGSAVWKKKCSKTMKTCKTQSEFNKSKNNKKQHIEQIQEG